LCSDESRKVRADDPRPLGRREALGLPAVEAVTEKRGVSPAQADVAWVTRPENVVAVSKSAGRYHRAANLDSVDPELEPEDFERIDVVEARKRFVERDGAHR
jgi:2,5-diketo-D-gluconate reductase B